MIEGKEFTYKIDMEAIKKKRIFIATPMYGGNCSALYSLSMNQLAYICGSNDLKIYWHYIYNEALITRGRNAMVKEFLKSDSDYLFFIDGDIQFQPYDVLCLVDLAIKNKNMKIITGAYPKKGINWDRIKSLYDNDYVENAADVENFIGNYVYNLKNGEDSFPLDKPFKVQEAGTGFMLIKREVFTKFKKAYPEQTYREYNTEEPTVAYFDCKIDSKEKKYLSEDYMFCQYASKIGIDTWLVPWINLNHMGSYLFKGSFSNVSRLDLVLKEKENE
jgi:hypothetical protein